MNGNSETFINAARIAAGCAGKERFASFALASRTANKSAHRHAAPLEAYACENCNGFHVGAKRPPPGAAASVARRCDACRNQGSPYCPHARVLVIFIDEAPVSIVSESEERARVTANLLRVKLKGKPFSRPRTKQ